MGTVVVKVPDFKSYGVPSGIANAAQQQQQHVAERGVDFFSLPEKRKTDLRGIYKRTVSYRPSALCEEEVFCYKKQLNGHLEDIYKIKQEFIQSLQESQRHFERLKSLMVKYEQENNLNSTGYEN